MNVIPRFDFLEVSRTEELVFPEKILSIGSRKLNREDDGHVPFHFAREYDDTTGISDSISSSNLVADKPKHHYRREQFRLKIEKVALSLAAVELAVLEGIVEQGNDAQVDLAHERLKRSFPSTLAMMMEEPDKACQASSSRHRRRGSSARRASLLMQRQNSNTTHNAMLNAMWKTKWHSATKTVINAKRLLNGRHMSSSSFLSASGMTEQPPNSLVLDGSNTIDSAAPVKRPSHNWHRHRRTKTPAEIKEMALVAINAAKDDGSSGTEKFKKTMPLDRVNEGILPKLLQAQINKPSSSSGKRPKKYNPWERVDEDFSGCHFDFNIIGTSANDTEAMPHVLSPPIMHRLQEALPFSKRGESFWLKYSLVRDGASLATFLNKMRGTKYGILAIETVEGEVFGALTGEPWHLDLKTYGSAESFVWRMRHSRSEISDSIAEQAQRESDIDIFGYSYENSKMVQLCQSHPHCRMAIGGGSCHYPRGLRSGEIIQPYQWGYSIAFDDNCLLEGTTSPSITFLSPSLSEFHSDGSRFEVLNLEGWALTPCLSVEEAEIMECRRTFLEREAVL